MENPRPIISYRTPSLPPLRRVRSLGEELLKLSLLSAVFVIYGIYGDPYKPVLLFFYAGIVGWIAIAVIMVGVRRYRVRYRVKDALPCELVSVKASRSIKAVFVLMFLLPFLSPIGYYNCPHGQRWANRFIGIAWSSNGGPCGNGIYHRGSAMWHVGGNWYAYLSRSNP